MSISGLFNSRLFGRIVVVLALAVMVRAQNNRETRVAKPSTLPNPFRLVPDWPTLPADMRLDGPIKPFTCGESFTAPLTDRLPR